jgi:O-antigen ligase
MWLALAALVLLARRKRSITRRSASILTTVAILVTLGAAGMRGSDLRDFAAFLGIHRNETPGAIESYPQRALLSYIGLKIFLAEPITGVGYQGSNDQFAFGPQLAAAHRRFPGQPDVAFPSPSRRLGVQNFYIEVLADLGVIGIAALAALFASALYLGIRGSAASPLPLVGIAWLLVAAGVWIGIGIVPGIPLAALTWLGFGLVSVRG